MSPIDLLRVVRRRWLAIVAVVLVGLVAGAAVFLVTPRRYSASATLYVAAQSNRGGAEDAYEGAMLSQNRVKSYKELLESTQFADGVAARLGGSTSTRDLLDRTTVTSQADTVLLTVTTSEADPQQASRVANAYGDVFIDTVGRLERPAGPAQPAPVVGRVAFPATTPSAPTSPDLALDLLAGGIVGLLGGLVLAVVRQRTDVRITDPETLSSIAQAPSLGVIETVAEAATTPLVVLVHPTSTAAEAFRRLRTNLQFVGVDADSRVIMMTSSVPVEGKSTTIVNLAAALAVAGHRVVLVDADLRRPSVAGLVGVESGAGLTSTLSGRLDPLSAIQPTRLGFDAIPSGPVPPNPSELLGSRRMMHMLATLRARYDWVLVDSAPLLPVTDAAVLAGLCDRVVLACRHRVTTSPMVAAAVRTVQGAGTSIAGTVLTMTPPGAAGDYDGFGSDYRSLSVTPVGPPVPTASPAAGEPARRTTRHSEEPVARRSTARHGAAPESTARPSAAPATAGEQDGATGRLTVLAPDEG